MAELLEDSSWKAGRGVSDLEGLRTRNETICGVLPFPFIVNQSSRGTSGGAAVPLPPPPPPPPPLSVVSWTKQKKKKKKKKNAGGLLNFCFIGGTRKKK